MQDSYFILSGYRRPTNSHYHSFLTLCHMHNETGNIWSHLLGCIAFLFVITPLTYSVLLPGIIKDAVGGLELTLNGLMIAPFLATAVVCLALSATYHTLWCTSEKMALAYVRMDYAGIILLIVGSFAPAIHYAFFCAPQTAHIYLGLQTALGLLALLNPRFSAPHFAAFRASLFVILALAGVIPVFHVVILYGLEYALLAESLGYLLVMGTLYFLGAVLYAVRWPESHWPGLFDYWLHSHQLFHILVLAAALTHWQGAIAAARWWHGGAIMGNGEVWEGLATCSAR
ncbi:Hly-III related protein [Gonapodya prolifera JEL478]|uniref:Hly-III related protein n=1 Tax=Gonapodya prolifera (strain JEL478) TaxID=1344416 RepID=A0A139A7K1_GONPJ|nr:Hly-III related protein [Gonapodya prolifera JEL478]|eukprot:KXS12415.1 Hly-III related protein [Gonapodya prolifera JEL478]